MSEEDKIDIEDLLRLAESYASEPYARPAAAVPFLIKAVKLMWAAMQEVSDDPHRR